jgi:hypothetical protein
MRGEVVPAADLEQILTRSQSLDSPQQRTGARSRAKFLADIMAVQCHGESESVDLDQRVAARDHIGTAGQHVYVDGWQRRGEEEEEG